MTTANGYKFVVDGANVELANATYEWTVTGSGKAFTASLKVTAVTGDVAEMPAGGIDATLPEIVITVNEKPAFIYGDVDGNGVVNARDCSYLFKYIANKSWDSAIKNVEYAFERANVDLNTAVNARDASHIFKYIADKTYELPVK